MVNRALTCLRLILLSGVSTIVAADLSQKVDDLYSLSLEELTQVKITTLSRSEESKDLAPGSVYVFDADTIHKRGYRSLGDLFARTVGNSRLLRIAES